MKSIELVSYSEKRLAGTAMIAVYGPSQHHPFSDRSWPAEISETDFLEKLNNLPKAKTYLFL